MSRPAVILDCDPGHDDAVALAAAAHFCELLAVTTVSGNVGLELTTRNALAMLQTMGLGVPVHAGASLPLLGRPLDAARVHGADGFGGVEIPPLEREASGHDAVAHIIDTARARDDLWLVAVGPLTNVALALRQAPDLADRLQGVAIMGGGVTFGNVTATAEFNIRADPEAAQIVFSSAVHKILAPLDLTHRLQVGDDDAARFAATGTATGRLLAELLRHYVDAYERLHGRRSGALHDPCAVLAITHPELFESEGREVSVELRGELTRGMTVVDRRGPPDDAATCRLLTGIDSATALDLLVHSAASFD